MLHRQAQGVGKPDKRLAFLTRGVLTGIVHVRQRRIVMEQNPVEAGIAGQIFIDVRHLLAHLRVPRGEPDIGLGGFAQLAGLTIPALHARQGRIEIEREHRHPREDFHARAGLQLPGDKIKKICPDRQTTVGEIERLDPAVALRVGKRLQENMADLHVVNPLDQPVDVLGLLGRIGIVNVIEIDVHDAHGIALLNLADRAGKRLERGIPGDQQAGDVAQILHVPQPVLKGKGQLVTLLSGDSERRTAGGAVGPDPGARRLARHLSNFFSHFANVIADPLVELLVGFIATRGFVIKAVGDGRLAAALRVGRNTVMRGPGVRSDLNQRGPAELAHHVPRREAIPGRHQAAKIHLLMGWRIDPTAHRRPQRGDVPGLKQRPDAGVKAAVAVVKAEQNGFWRQRFFPVMRVKNVLHADGVVAVVQKPAYLLV